MKNLFKRSLLASAAVVLTFSMANIASAETVLVPVTANIQNTFDLEAPTAMNFGIFSALAAAEATAGGNDAPVATLTISTAGVLTPTSSGAGVGAAKIALVNPTAAAAARVTVAGAAPATNLNVTIQDVTDPVNITGVDPIEFTLSDFTTLSSGPSQTERTRAVNTSFQLLTDATGAASLAIGARLTTPRDFTAAGAMPNGDYEGSFNVVVNY